jgi:hypothetical protein
MFKIAKILVRLLCRRYFSKSTAEFPLNILHFSTINNILNLTNANILIFSLLYLKKEILYDFVLLLYYSYDLQIVKGANCVTVIDKLLFVLWSVGGSAKVIFCQNWWLVTVFSLDNACIFNIRP